MFHDSPPQYSSNHQQMYSLTLILLLALSASAYKRDPDGFIEFYGGCSPWPWARTCPLTTLDYPAQSPPNVKYLWQQGTVSYPGDKPAVKLVCYDFRLSEGPDGECEEALIAEEEGSMQRFCGYKGSFIWISKTENVNFRLTQGLQPGFINCSMGTILVDERGLEATTTTTTPPPPTLPAFHYWESEEVDSDEHGVAPGTRSTTCKCGWTNKATSRIVNGTEADINEFPFAAVLVIRKSGNHICGASIITKRHAITAAHCTYSFRDLAILVGEHRLYKRSETPYTRKINVLRIVDHPDYNKPTKRYDISILDLAKDIKFNQFIGPVCLPTGPLDLEKQYVKIIGWGNLEFRGRHSLVINKADVRIVPHEQCEISYTSARLHKEKSQICTYAKMKATCQGDSGGPVIWLDPETNRYTLIGAVSFAAVCGDLHPSVHASITYHLKWINQHIQASGLETCTKQ